MDPNARFPCEGLLEHGYFDSYREELKEQQQKHQHQYHHYHHNHHHHHLLHHHKKKVAAARRRKNQLRVTVPQHQNFKTFPVSAGGASYK